MKLNLKIQIYILKELLSPFILSLFVFLFTILMVQAFRFTDILLMSGGEWAVILDLLKNLIVSTFPIIFPLSLLAAILLGYSRLSQDSELVAFSSLGYSYKQLIVPAFILGAGVFYLSYLSVTVVGPRGAQISRQLAKQVQAETLKTSLKPGVFVNISDVTFYLQEINHREKESFKNIFILDRRNNKKAVILSETGRLAGDEANDSANEASYLKLGNGNIHFQPRLESHAVVSYKEYDLAFANQEAGASSDSPKAYTSSQLKGKVIEYENLVKKNQKFKDNPPQEYINNDKAWKKKLSRDQESLTEFRLEFTKRTQIAMACLVFLIMGLSFGFHTFSRVSRSESLGVCLGLSLVYWIVYFVFESLSYKTTNALFLYFPNLIFLLISFVYLIYRNGGLKFKLSQTE